jgi:hypothetical protein
MGPTTIERLPSERHRAAERADALSASTALLDRARSLHDNAATLHPLVASAYRRRAAELRFAAWVGAVRSGVEEPLDAA